MFRTHQRLNLDALSSYPCETLQFDNKYAVGPYTYLENRLKDNDDDNDGYEGQVKVLRGSRFVDSYLAFDNNEEETKANLNRIEELNNGSIVDSYSHETQNAIMTFNSTMEPHYVGRILASFDMPTIAYFARLSKLAVYRELEQTTNVYRINWHNVKAFFESVFEESLGESWKSDPQYYSLKKFIIKAKLQSMANEISVFDKECAEKEYTNTEVANWLLQDCEKLLRKLSTLV